MAGPKQHFLPAAFIGRFSATPTGRARKRRVWVRRRSDDRPFETAAQRVGFALDLYTLVEPEGLNATLVDDMWSPVEAKLPEALDALVAGREGWMDARPWAATLVPFFASLFVRGPEFTRRFKGRLAETLGEFHDEIVRNQDNTTFARLMELQRLYAVVMHARWTVAHFPEDVPLITTDIGYSLTQDAADGSIGYAIPVDPFAAVALYARPEPPRLCWRDDGWIAGPINHIDMPAAAAQALNHACAGSAIDEIYGPTLEAVTAVGGLIATEDAAAVGPGYLIADGVSLRDTEMAWFQLLSRLNSPPDAARLAAEGDLVGAAIVAEEDGNLDEALAFREQIVRAAEQALGPDHSATRAARRDVAHLLRRQDDLTGAAEVQEEIVDSAVRAEGERSRVAAEARINLAITLRLAGRLEEARQHGRLALAAAQSLGEQDPTIVHAAWGLFLTLYELGDETGRQLRPLFMWLREADPATLGPPELDLRRELVRLFAVDRVTDEDVTDDRGPREQGGEHRGEE